MATHPSTESGWRPAGLEELSEAQALTTVLSSESVLPLPGCKNLAGCA